MKEQYSLTINIYIKHAQYTFVVSNIFDLELVCG